MEKGSSRVICPICHKANLKFERLNQQINQARTPKEKAPFAKQFIEKVDEVIKEHGATTDDPLRKACQSILALRKRTAELILKAQKLQ